MVLRQNTFHFPVKLCRDVQEAAGGVSERAMHRAWPVQAEVLPPDAVVAAEAPEAIRVPSDDVAPEADVVLQPA
eukprot:5119799-Alexandrium_andersonii.AAC.1